MKIHATIDIVDDNENSRGTSCKLPIHMSKETTVDQLTKLIGIASEDQDAAEWIKFQDDDGDWVTIKNDDDVSEMVTCAMDQSKKINIRIHGPEDVANLEQLVAKTKAAKKRGRKRGGRKEAAFLVTTHNRSFDQIKNNNNNNNEGGQTTKTQNTNVINNNSNYNVNYNERKDAKIEAKTIKKIKKEQKKRLNLIEQKLLPKVLDTFESGCHDGIQMLVASASGGIQTTMEELKNSNPNLKSGDAMLSEYESELLVQTLLQVLNQQMPLVIQEIEHSVRKSLVEFQEDDKPIQKSSPNNNNNNNKYRKNYLLNSAELMYDEVEEKYNRELCTLVEFGFTNMHQNRSLLFQHNGDITAVIDALSK